MSQTSLKCSVLMSECSHLRDSKVTCRGCSLHAAVQGQMKFKQPGAALRATGTKGSTTAADQVDCEPTNRKIPATCNFLYNPGHCTKSQSLKHYNITFTYTEQHYVNCSRSLSNHHPSFSPFLFIPSGLSLFSITIIKINSCLLCIMGKLIQDQGEIIQ